MSLVNLCFQNFARYLKADGLILATFVEGDTDTEGDSWEYPECVAFRPSTIKQLAGDVGLVGTSIPWFRPRQTWYVFAKNQDRLPTEAMFPYLHGAVLFDSALETVKK